MIKGIVRGLRRFGRRPAGMTLVVLLTLGVGTACGPATPSAAAPVTLSFLSYNFGTSDLGGQGTQDLIDAFQRANPDVRIKPQGVETRDVLTKLRASVAGGAAFDVAQVGWSKMAEAYQTLPVVPVQKIPSEKEWQDTVLGFNQNVLKATAKDGVVTAMPYTMSIPTLFYNTDLFRRAGLDPERPPITVAEVKDAALAIRRGGAEGVYFDAANASKSDFLTQSLINSNGGAVLSADHRVTVDQPPAVGALAAMGDLTRSGAQPGISEDDAVAAFKAGHLGMLVTSTAVLSSLDQAAAGKFEVRAAGFPSFGALPARPTYSGAGLVVLAQDPAKQQAAWRFIRFLTSAQAFTTITTKIGYLPLRPEVVTNPAYLGDYFAKDGRLRPALTQLDSLTPYTFFPGAKANQAVVALQDEAVAPIVLRGADPQSTLTAVAQKIRTLVGP